MKLHQAVFNLNQISEEYGKRGFPLGFFPGYYISLLPEHASREIESIPNLEEE